MKKIDVENLNRKKTYDWFKSFRDSTYGVNLNIDVTDLVKFSKETHTSFFINFLYVLVKSLNSIDEMKMRFLKDEAVMYDVCNPGITVLTKNDTFENVRFCYVDDYKKFYKLAREKIDQAKNEEVLTKDSYNLTDAWNEYYITSLPWISFTGVTHPIPDDVHSQVVPRICFGKYFLESDKYLVPFNITVSHIFVDGYHISKLINVINDNLKDFVIKDSII